MMFVTKRARRSVPTLQTNRKLPHFYKVISQHVSLPHSRWQFRRSFTTMANDYSVVWVTVPSEDCGKDIAYALLNDRLAACVNVVPKIRSYYWWEGKIQEDSEYLLMIKTKTVLVNELIAKVKSIHPYTVPEVISVPLGEGNPSYLDWIATSTK